MITTTQELAVTVTPRNRANFRRLKTNSIQSVKRWEKENELLYAMMEDESEWLAKLFPDVVISPEFFFYALEDGSLLCRLANYIQEKAELYSQKQNVPVPGKKFRYHTMSKCGREIKLFRSRENVQQFLTWCRSHGIPEAILFESNDVVQVDEYREGCRGVIICLMEIVRKTAKFELDELPQLIRMEKEIEEDEAQGDTELSNGQGQILDVEQINNMTDEIDNLEVQQTDQPEIQSPSSLDSDSGVESVFDQEEGENSASRLTEFNVDETEDARKTTAVTRKQTSSKPKDQKSSPKSRTKTKELPSLLESTGPKSELDKQICKLAQDYNIKIVHRLKEGKYIILGRIMFVRMLNDHMLVRIGGGWDTLEHYLMTHAPSKQAVDNSSTPNSQVVASPRNSISAGSGHRSSLFDKIKRKEQIGIVRDSQVYSSQGSLNQLSRAQSSPRLKDCRTKKVSVTEKDEKDISDAIRKIESSLSENLSTRPVSFTSKTFHQLKSRFDKGIFGTSRRTSSPDLSLKGKKVSRRSSDIPTMADIATVLTFDGVNEDQHQTANNNDSDLKQSESGEAEEAVLVKVTAPSEDLLGDETLQKDHVLQPEHASDEIDGSAPGGDFPSTDHANESNWTDDLLGGPVNGSENYAAPPGANLVDISSFDPFAAAPDQGELISIDSAPSEKIEEQPNTTEVTDNGHVADDGQSGLESAPEAVSETTEKQDGFEQFTPEPEESAEESLPPIDLGDLLADTESVETKTEENSVESSPPVILEDLLPDTESSELTETKAGGESIESSSTIVQEDATIPEAQPADVTEEVVTNSFEEVHSTEEVKPDEPTEQVKPDEPVLNEDVQDVPPIVVDLVVESELESRNSEEDTAKVDEPVPSEEAVVKSEGESPEAAPVLDETTTQKQSQQEIVTVVESVSVILDESKEEVTEETTTQEQSQEEIATVVESVSVKVEESKEEAAPADEETKQAEEEAKPVEEEGKPTGEEVKPLEDVKPVEEAKPAEEEVKPAEDAKPVEEVKPTEEAKPTGEEAKPVEEVKHAEEKATPAEGQAPKTEKQAGKVAKTKPQSAGTRAKSTPKAAPSAAKPTGTKKPTGAAKPTSPTKAPSTAATKKDVKAPATKAPATKPSAKVPATKTTTSTAPGAKKPATKTPVTKTDEVKKPERPKSAVTARPPTKPSAPGAARPASAAPKKPPTSTTKPSAAKAPGKDVKDAGAPKSAPKTTASRPASAKPTPLKTSAPANKPTAAKPGRPQSAKPSDSADGAAKKLAARPQSAKPKPTSTTTTVKKTTTTTTTKSGAAPAKTTTTKTVTQVKNGPAKTTTTTTKKETTRPTSAAAKTAAGAKPTATGAKSKPGGKPSSGTASGKPSTKAAPKKKAQEPAKEKQDEKPAVQPVNVRGLASAFDEKPSEVVEGVTDEKPAEVVESVSEERPVEASPEEKSIELTPESAPAEQATEPAEVSPEGVEYESDVVTQIVTSQTTTIIADGEEQSSTTTTEETTFEQAVGES